MIQLGDIMDLDIHVYTLLIPTQLYADISINSKKKSNQKIFQKSIFEFDV